MVKVRTLHPHVTFKMDGAVWSQRFVKDAALAAARERLCYVAEVQDEIAAHLTAAVPAEFQVMAKSKPPQKPPKPPRVPERPTEPEPPVDSAPENPPAQIGQIIEAPDGYQYRVTEVTPDGLVKTERIASDEAK